MPNYIQDMMSRIAAMEVEACASIAVVEAHLWPYEQEAYPYFTNRLGEMTIDYDAHTEDIEVYNHQVLMRLIVDHYTAGYIGDKPDLANQLCEAVETYFREHEQLTTNAGSYTSVPDYLQELAQLTGHTGLVIMQNSGEGSLQLGIEFTLSVPFLREVY